jgi:hypothetical protein
LNSIAPNVTAEYETQKMQTLFHIEEAIQALGARERNQSFTSYMIAYS